LTFKIFKFNLAKVTKNDQSVFSLCYLSTMTLRFFCAKRSIFRQAVEPTGSKQ
jgi:hypothetical protein